MKSLLVSVVLMLGLNAYAAAPNCEADSNYPEISKADLQKSIDAKAVTVVDVNGSASYKKAHVTGAVDFATVKADFAKVLPAQKDAMIVAYCGGPSCVAWKKAAVEACKLGYTNVKHYKDGIKGWTAKN